MDAGCDCPPTLPSGWSTDLIDFVKQCLVHDVNQRPCVEELMNASVCL